MDGMLRSNIIIRVQVVRNRAQFALNQEVIASFHAQVLNTLVDPVHPQPLSHLLLKLLDHLALEVVAASLVTHPDYTSLTLLSHLSLLHLPQSLKPYL